MNDFYIGIWDKISAPDASQQAGQGSRHQDI